jgi:uncharacterized protein (TIGR02246 family)
MSTEVSAAEQAAVATLTQQMLASWAYQDADGIAELFTEDGTLVLPGIYFQGKEAIREYFKDAFANKYNNTQVVGKPISMRFFGPEVALLLSSGGVLAPGETEVSDGQAIRAAWFVVKTDGKWKLAAYQNSPAKRGLPDPGQD